MQISYSAAVAAVARVVPCDLVEYYAAADFVAAGDLPESGGRGGAFLVMGRRLAARDPSLVVAAARLLALPSGERAAELERMAGDTAVDISEFAGTVTFREAFAELNMAETDPPAVDVYELGQYTTEADAAHAVPPAPRECGCVVYDCVHDRDSAGCGTDRGPAC